MQPGTSRRELSSGAPTQRHPRASLLALVALLLAMLAPQPAAAQRGPRLETARCPFKVPAGFRAACSFLVVAEDRARPDGRQIRLAVAVLRATGQKAVADPVLYLAGGPGSPAVKGAAELAKGWAPFLAGRELIVIDQRGVGLSQPSLACPESEQLTFASDGSEERPPDAGLDALLRCRDRLEREGVDLGAYTTSVTAADLEELRVALGHKQWNVFGISYGTRLALAYLRDYPASARSVVLDSVYPAQVDLFTPMPSNLDRSLRRLLDGCAADRRCRAAYPDLESTLYTLLNRLDADPATIKVADPRGGQPLSVTVDGARMVELIFRTLYSTASIPQIPKMIAAAARGDYTLVAQLETRRLSRAAGISHALYFAVECGSDIGRYTDQQAAEAAAAFPHFARYYAGLTELTPTIRTVCAAWDMPPEPAREREPVRSDVPALLFAGEYDPITPPAWAELAAATLGRSTVVVFPGTGHAAIGRGACPARIMRAFLDRPAARPDVSCAAALGQPAFITK